jgi:hypothetical protein
MPTSQTFRPPDEVPSFRLAHVLREARRDSSFAEDLEIARGRREGPIVPPAQGVRWLAETLVERVRDRYDAVVAITGPEGGAKSTLAAHLVEEIQDYSGVPWNWSNFTDRTRAIVAAYRRAPRPVLGALPKPTTVWFDESSRNLLGGDTMDPEQKVLIQVLFQGRAKGVILLLLIPDIQALAKKVRGRRAVFWVDVDSRGTDRRPAPSHAAVFERDARRRFKPTTALGLAESRRCPELTFEPYAFDNPFWAAYDRRKHRDFDEYLDEADLVLDRHETKTFGRILGRPKI